MTSTTGVKKDHTFQLIAHDGVRFFKIVLLMENQSQIIKNIHTRNKFYLHSGYLDTASKRETLVMVDTHEQIEFLFSDAATDKLTENQHQI